ncbi:hypothetical protein [Sphingobacterium multivorum]|uniref:hypothetical protein n=1 Tax=Sphingobacterium multivorum TaxID=28454 RepID=UPI0028A293B0|nr:hypothetical protein [Sphingobacterium multivorum]
MRKIKNNLFVSFFLIIIFIITGCAGNNICINLNEKKIISKEGDIVRFEIEDDNAIYYFHLKGRIRHQKTVDLENIDLNNDLVRMYPESEKSIFLLKPNRNYIFTNRTVYDASRASVKFYIDSLGNFHCLDNLVCE